MFPLYVQYTRLYEETLKVSVANKLRFQAVDSQRYYHSFYDNNDIFVEEGVNSTNGYNGFNIEEFDTENYGIDQFESVLIYEYLVKINNLLSKHNIKTIQSGISYWENDVNFPEASFFQLPWIEFAGNVNSINIFKKITEHKLAKSYMSFTFGESFGKDKNNSKQTNTIIRTSLLRPYINSQGDLISDFTDKDFWENIVQIIKDVCENESDEESNDVCDYVLNKQFYDEELNTHMDKPWFILDESGTICELTEEEKIHHINPFSDSIPLSTLIVRFDTNINSFMRPI